MALQAVNLLIPMRSFWHVSTCWCGLLAWLLVAASLVPDATAAERPAAGTVTGRITDASTGEALPGASVRVEGTSIGGASNLDGYYTIPSAPSGTQTLVVSYIGYEEHRRVVEIPDGGRITVDFELVFQSIEGEEVIVTAQVAGQLAAINEQFRDATVKNVVSRDRIQELPDNNAAESIGRLPGVSIQRSGGEANRVAIRGLSPKFNTVTVNGVRLPSTDGNERSVDLSLVSSNILDGIEVRKAITPDMDADVVGGSVDLRLRSAPSGFLVDLLAQGGYTGLQEDFGNYKFVGTLSNRFFAERLGAIATFNLEHYDRSADKLGIGYTDEDVSGLYQVPAIVNFNTREETIDRSRVGGSLLLDYRLPYGRITGNAFYNELNNDALYRFFNPTESSITYNVEDRKQEVSILTSGLGMEQNLRWIEFDVQAAYTRSRGSSPDDYIWNFARDGSAFRGGRDTRLGLPADSVFAMVRADSTAPLANLWVDSRRLDENQTSLALNASVPFRFGNWFSGFFKTGGKLRWLDRTYDAERNGRQGLQYPGLWNTSSFNCVVEALGEEWASRLQLADSLAYLPIYAVQANYGRGSDFLDGAFGLGHVADERLLRQLTQALQSEGCADQYLNNSITSLGEDYSGVEAYQAGYVMARFDFGRFLTLIPGIRYERDYSEYTGQRFREIVNAYRDAPPADMEELIVERENTYWLPMVHLDVRPAYWMSLRLARTETISRPGYNQYAPITSINTWGSYIRATNSQLRPAQATNYDASVQFISDRFGLLGLAAFHKTIDDLILQVEYPTNAAIGAPEGTNVPDAWLSGSPQLQTFVNNEEPATFYGYEIEWQTNFSYLPGALRGIVLNLNYTRSFSETTYHFYRINREFIPGSRPPRYNFSLVDSSRTGRMPDQAAHIANVTLGYDYKGFSARASYLFQSNTTSWINTRESLLDTFVGDYSRFDFSVRQKVREGVEVFANLNNLNNRPDRSFTGQSSESAGSRFIQDYPSYRELYGYTIDLGVRYRF